MFRKNSASQPPISDVPAHKGYHQSRREAVSLNSLMQRSWRAVRF